jgi:hypothetical protein
MRAFLIIGIAALLIFGAFAIHPGLGIFVAILSYGAVENLLRKVRRD